MDAGGVEGGWRFVQRIYRLVTETEGLPPPARQAIDSSEGADLDLRRATHRAIQAVTDDLNALRFNRAVAQIYTLANAIGAAEHGGPRGVARGAGDDRAAVEPDDAASRRDLLEAPRPRDAGVECAVALRHAPAAGQRHDHDCGTSERQSARRDHDSGGRRRGNRKQAALALEPVKRLLDGKPPRRIIVVPGRIVNVVAG